MVRNTSSQNFLVDAKLLVGRLQLNEEELLKAQVVVERLMLSKEAYTARLKEAVKPVQNRNQNQKIHKRKTLSAGFYNDGGVLVNLMTGLIYALELQLVQLRLLQSLYHLRCSVQLV